VDFVEVVAIDEGSLRPNGVTADLANSEDTLK
jgi:hypothetical protein